MNPRLTGGSSLDRYPTAGEAAAGLREMHGEAGGAIVMRVVRPFEMDGLIAASLEGDGEASAVLRVLEDYVLRAAQAPRNDPMTCRCCQRPIRKMRFSLAIALPMCDGPRNALALGICMQCGTDVPTIRTRAMAVLSTIWPDIRPIAVTHPAGGRA